MVIRIELEPSEEAALIKRTRAAGRDPIQYAYQLIKDDLAGPDGGGREGAANSQSPLPEELLDHEFIAACAILDGRDVPTVEEVRMALAGIPGSLSDEIIADREDRF